MPTVWVADSAKNNVHSTFQFVKNWNRFVNCFANNILKKRGNGILPLPRFYHSLQKTKRVARFLL